MCTHMHYIDSGRRTVVIIDERSLLSSRSTNDEGIEGVAGEIGRTDEGGWAAMGGRLVVVEVEPKDESRN